MLIELAAFLLLAVTSTAGANAQSTCSNLLVGSWKEAQASPAGHGEWTTEFRANGTFTQSGYIERPDTTRKVVDIHGTWTLTKDVLFYAVTKSADPQFIPVGTTSTDRVREIGHAAVVYVDKVGRVLRMDRSSPPTQSTARCTF